MDGKLRSKDGDEVNNVRRRVEITRPVDGDGNDARRISECGDIGRRPLRWSAANGDRALSSMQHVKTARATNRHVQSHVIVH